jgi:hypothetical protein
LYVFEFDWGSGEEGEEKLTQSTLKAQRRDERRNPDDGGASGKMVGRFCATDYLGGNV